MAVPENTADESPLLPASTVTAPSAGAEIISKPLISLLTGKRGDSITVRQSVIQNVEYSREDFRYWLPIAVIDTIWNLLIVAVSVIVLILTVSEKLDVLLFSGWICGYSLQCVVHVVLLWKEYRRRNMTSGSTPSMTIQESLGRSWRSFMGGVDPDAIISPYRRWKKLNTMISYMWWVIGVILMAFDCKILLHVAPHLFWLALALLAIGAFFATIYILMSCLLLLAVSFCLPRLLVAMYSFGLKEGASEVDIKALPKYTFEVSNGEEQADGIAGRLVPTRTSGPDFFAESILATKDEADCCICLRHYEHGAELHSLPCDHHFHAECILKWLMVKATCPICKNVISRIEQV